MNNKTLIAAGLGVLSLGTLGVVGITSAATATDAPTSTTTQISSHPMRGGGKWDFWPGMGGGKHGWEFGGRGMFGPQDDATKAALEANDYNAFLKAWESNTNKPTDVTAPTQEQFTKMVEGYKKQVVVEQALKDNNYDAYVQATTPTKEEFAQRVSEYTTRTAMKAAVDAKDYDAFVKAWESNTNKPSDATVPTQEQFNKMVTRSEQ